METSGEQEQGKMLYEYLVQPQNWDRYTYALNNPLKHTDPTGMRAPTKYEQDALDTLDQLAIEAEAAGKKELAAALRAARKAIADIIASLARGKADVGVNIAVSAILNIGGNNYNNDSSITIKAKGYSVTLYKGNKCNVFVCDTHARGAGLGLIANGTAGKRGFPLVYNKELKQWLPPVANWLGDENYKLTNLAIVKDGTMKPGDIVAWKNKNPEEAGHSSIHIGGNVLVYAGADRTGGVPIAETMKYVDSVMHGWFSDHNAPVVRRYNGKP
jgi:hypothetical protein